MENGDVAVKSPAAKILPAPVPRNDVPVIHVTHVKPAQHDTGAPCSLATDLRWDTKEQSDGEANLEGIRNRVLREELPFVMTKILQLLEQIREEFEPLHESSFLLASSATSNDMEEKKVRRSTSSGFTSASRTSPLQFFRSKAKMDTEASTLGASVVVGAPDVGLHMYHKHSGRAVNNSISPALSNSSVSSGLRSLSSFSNKKGFHVVHGSAPSSAAPSVSYSPSANTWMDVNLQMDGFYIRHATIDLKLHKHQKNILTRSTNSTHSFHTQINQPQNPWVLDQVKFVYQTAVNAASNLRAFQKRFAEKTDPVSKEESLEAQKVMHQLICALIESRNAMSNPKKNHFPSVLRSAADKTVSHFNPPPPKELLLEFSVHHDELIVSAFELHFLSSAKEPTMVSDSWVPIYDYTHNIFHFKEIAKSVEVVDQVQVHFKVHSLQWVLENIFEAYNIAIKQLRKVESLNRHEVSCKLANVADSHQAAEIREIAEFVKGHSVLPRVHHSNWVSEW